MVAERPLEGGSLREADRPLLPVPGSPLRAGAFFRANIPLVRKTILLAAALAAGLLLGAPADAKRRAEVPDPHLIYDGEYGGYVAIVDGIQRPDLTADETGRVAESKDEALRIYREKAGQEPPGDSLSRHLLVHAPEPEKRGRRAKRRYRRWVKKVGVSTEIFVHDRFGVPVEDALVFRFHDPSFYAWNQARGGARLVDGYRMRPRPFPTEKAGQLLETYLDRWVDAGAYPVAAGRADYDLEDNPWVRWYRAESLPPLEYVGRTDADGHVSAVSGVFNLLREDSFPMATMPRAIRVGYLVAAEGFLTEVSVERFSEGGVRESRHLSLAESPDHELMTSSQFLAAVAAAAELGASGGASGDEDLEARDETLRGLLGSLELSAPRVDPEHREAALRRAQERVLRAAAARAPLNRREALLRWALRFGPDSAHLHHQLGSTLAALEGVYPYEMTVSTTEPTPRLQEAEQEARLAVELDPSFAPAYALADRLAALRGAPAEEREALLDGLLELNPYDRWARARAATVLLRDGHPSRALQHLPYTWAAGSRFGVDLPLALALAEYYRAQGLPEKAGYFAFTTSGRVPEDPEAAYPPPEEDAQDAP